MACRLFDGKPLTGYVFKWNFGIKFSESLIELPQHINNKHESENVLPKMALF